MRKANLNTSILEELPWHDGENTLPQLISGFRSSLPRSLSDFHAALENEDSATVEAVARNLKSNSADLGATQLQDLCGRIEKMARKHDLQSVASVLEDFSAEAEAVLRALEDYQRNKRQAA